MKATLYERQIPLETPFITALRRVDAVDDIVLKLEVDGEVGYGSASPTKAITNDDRERIIRETLKLLPIVKAEVENKTSLLSIDKALKNYTNSVSSRYMIMTALYDLFGNIERCSVIDYFSFSFKAQLESDITISLDTPDKMKSDALKAVKKGYKFLKLKVGGNWKLDVERLLNIQEVLKKDTQLRLDANQAWSDKEAIKIINDLEKYHLNIDLIEQPTPASDFSALKRVKENTPFPIMADESVFNLEDALRLIETKSADIINIKLAKCGGFYEALKIAESAKQEGLSCMIGCMMEGPIGMVAASQFAASQDVITRYDSDCPMLYKKQIGEYSTKFNNNLITVIPAFGLGINSPDLSKEDIICTM